MDFDLMEQIISQNTSDLTESNISWLKCLRFTHGWNPRKRPKYIQASPVISIVLYSKLYRMFNLKRIPSIYWVLTLCIIQGVLYGLTANTRVEGIVAP